MFELIAAPFTPLHPSGDLNLEAIPRLAEHLQRVAVDGAFVAGSTGEGLSLTSAERRQLAERWVEVGGNLRVIVHVGHTSLHEARELARHAAAIGAAAIAAAPPNWFKTQSVEGLAESCATIAAGAPNLPFLYYHIPALSGVSVPMRQLLPIVRERIPNFAGVKYTHLDPVDFQACVREHGDTMQLLWGCDEMLVAGLDLGAHGAVGSTYNFAAPLYRQLIAAHGKGDIAAARTLQSRAALLIETLDRRGYMAAAKNVMKFLGVDCGPVRLPLPQLPAAEEGALKRDLERIGFFDWIQTASAS